ncbi:MAG: ATP-dependent helicase [Candidatus Wildermuthbacteria bacterium]|nr:ATP-dependent helicase [Candidatus Wildermuthbacteria bacterium]
MDGKKTTGKFEELYAKLNPEQKEAVDTIEGSVMVIAGPGTGKTHVLTLRIAKILLEADVNPENILALTFTDAAAYEMKRRLGEIIGGSAAHGVEIFTFHAFCNDIIQQNPEDFPEIIGSVPVGNPDRVRLAREILEKGKFSLLRPFGSPLYYVYPLLKIVSDLKREGIAKEAFEKMVQRQEEQFQANDELFYANGIRQGELKSKYKSLERQVAKNKEVAVFYAMYQEALAAHGFYDYDDMILKVVERLSADEDLLVSLQERYHYILADEHQDVNNAQNTVLEFLCNYSDAPNLFIVGDEKQAIFRFQGASLENFLYFQKRYPNAKIIRLWRNYRSSQNILDAASALMAQEKKFLVAEGKNDIEAKIRVYGLSNESEEMGFLANAIKEKISGGASAKEIAVLYRDNKDAEPVSFALKRAGLSFAIEADEEILADEDIEKIIDILQAIGDFGNENLLIKILHIDFLNILPLEFYKLVRWAKEQRKNLYDVLENVEKIDSLGESSKKKIHELYDKLSSWSSKSHYTSLLELAEEVMRESGFLKEMLSRQNSPQKLAKARRLLHFIQSLLGRHRQYKLSEFLEYLPILKEGGISLKQGPSALEASEGVRLMTAHKSKGREFDYVFIIKANQGKWGGKRMPKQFTLPADTRLASSMEEDDEERKLFFVALTRARKEVIISFAKENDEGRMQLPSRFLEELGDGIKIVENVPTKAQSVKEEILLRDIKEPKKPPLEDKKFLRETFLGKPFSATALNNYIECPWKYFYINLVGIPVVRTKFQAYGTAVHETLKDFFDAFKKDGDTTKEYLLSRFDRQLSKQMLNEEDFNRLEERGKKSLSGYYDFYYPVWIKNTLNEFIIPEVALDANTQLTGKLDKIEILPDGLLINVVDYKAAKPLSRNQIEGRVGNANGPPRLAGEASAYKRQLVFYKLLVDKFFAGKYKMVSAELDFIEPNERGYYKKERFEITAGEVKELEELIKKVVGEIMNFAFWDKSCGVKDCQFCALRQAGMPHISA